MKNLPSGWLFLSHAALLFFCAVFAAPSAHAQAIKMLPPTNCPDVTAQQIASGASNVWGVLGWDSKNPLSCVPNFQFGDNGYTGIGSATSMPTALLELYGDANYGNAMTVAPGSYAWPSTTVPLGNVHLNPTDNVDGYSTAITFGADAGYAGNHEAGIYVQYSSTFGTKMFFGTTNNYNTGSQIHVMIDQNGNVGIGTLTPAYALDVVGAARATAYYHASDARLKTNIHPITHALDKILALKGVDFNWKGDGRADMGVTAQNVATVFPAVVSKSPDGMMAVEYDSIIGPMIEALRELKADNDRLEIKVDALEKSLKAAKE